MPRQRSHCAAYQTVHPGLHGKRDEPMPQSNDGYVTLLGHRANGFLQGLIYTHRLDGSICPSTLRQVLNDFARDDFSGIDRLIGSHFLGLVQPVRQEIHHDDLRRIKEPTRHQLGQTTDPALKRHAITGKKELL